MKCNSLTLLRKVEATMPVHCEIDSESGTMIMKYEGEVLSSEVIEGRESLLRHPQFRKGMGLFVDLRAANPLGATREALEISATHLRSIAAPMELKQVAILTTTPESLARSRMFEVLMEESPILVRAFAMEDEAKLWLRAVTSAGA